MSISPRSIAASISLVNRPLPPASESARSWIMSPLVRMMTISNRASSDAMRRGEQAARLMRLREGERRAPGADFQGKKEHVSTFGC